MCEECLITPQLQKEINGVKETIKEIELGYHGEPKPINVSPTNKKTLCFCLLYISIILPPP